MKSKPGECVRLNWFEARNSNLPREIPWDIEQLSDWLHQLDEGIAQCATRLGNLAANYSGVGFDAHERVSFHKFTLEQKKKMIAKAADKIIFHQAG